MKIDVIELRQDEGFVIQHPIIKKTEDDCACNTGNGESVVVFKATAPQEVEK